MIKIGNEKLFTMTELMENLRTYLLLEGTEFSMKNGAYDFEISAVAAIIGESVDFVRGFVTSRKD
jgi:hypothetical protein